MSPASWMLSPAWLALGWTMLHLLWAGAVLWGLALVARRCLSAAGPAVRYAVALGLLVALALLPVGLFAVLWNGGLVPAPAVEVAGGPPHAVADPVAVAPPLPPGHPGVLQGSLAGTDGRLAAIARYLPWLWLSGAAVTLAWLAAGLMGVRRIRRGSRPLESPQVAALCRRLATSLGVSRRVVVELSEQVARPVLVGILRPIVVLPPALLVGCTPDQLEMILVHELLHVRRWDNLVNLFQRLVESLLFFHPAVWSISSWVRFERELCCDEVVVEVTGRRAAYAELLLALAGPAARPPRPAVALASTRLVDRLRRLLDPEIPAMTLSDKALATVGAVACTAIPVFLIQNPLTPGMPLDPFGGQEQHGQERSGEDTRPENPVAPQRGHPPVLAPTASCVDCHDAASHPLQQNPLARESKQDCAACHGEDHTGLGQLPPGSCSACHSEGGHGTHPIVPEASCIQCHAEGHGAGLLPGMERCESCHDASSSHDPFLEPTDCSACHVEDAHTGLPLPETGRCENCHDASSTHVPMPETVDCSACHAAGAHAASPHRPPPLPVPPGGAPVDPTAELAEMERRIQELRRELRELQELRAKLRELRRQRGQPD